jgi:serine/threonine-protein kinase
MTARSFDQLGPYRLQQVLGRGGMGTVYAATDERTGQAAAVKVLAPGLASDETFRDRFVAEIESLKKLHHPHIVELFGYGEHEGQLYYAMELVRGSNLQQELNRGRPFHWREVTSLAIDICRALKHAHDHGVIHRDLKPANLLLDQDEQVKLSDFGIAKLFGMANVTTSGSVLGTADYMAPEQAEGQGATPQCDLYSLGCVLYALLCGRPPFSGKSISEVVYKLRYEDPVPVQRLAHDVPAALGQIIDELLEKDPKRRIRTALVLSHRLKAMQHALTVRPSADESQPELPWPAGPGNGEEPPPDIAHRTTVSLPQTGSGAGDQHQAAAASSADSDVDPQEASEARTHFTPVDRTATEPVESGSESPLTAALLKVAIVTVLALLVAGVWYVSRPPTADQLYTRLIARVEPVADGALEEDDRKRMQRLLAAEPQMERFLTQYPGDPRRQQIHDLLDEIKVYRLTRLLETRARRLGANAALSPAEQIYLEATRRSFDDPAQAIRLLQGLVDLFTDQSAKDPDLRLCLEAARMQTSRLQRQMTDTRSRHLEMLQSRLAEARRLAERQPATATAIWRAVVALYADEDWAADAVRQARAALEAPNSPVPPEP